MSLTVMSAKSELLKLMQEQNVTPDSLPWISENDRWLELVFCLLDRCTKIDEGQIRITVQHLDELDLLNTNNLAREDESSNQYRRTISYILQRYGFSEQESNTAVKVLTRVSRFLAKEYEEDSKVHERTSRQNLMMVLLIRKR